MSGNNLCFNSDVCSHGDIRLVPISSSQALGRVEVCLSGVWSSVCGVDWDVADATVVCRQLGFTSNGAYMHAALFHDRCMLTCTCMHTYMYLHAREKFI